MRVRVFFYRLDRTPICSYRAVDITTADCVHWAISEFFRDYPWIREFSMEVFIVVED